MRYHHFGEGEYAMSEMVIQQLLIEAGASDLDQGLVEVDPKGLEVAADWSTLRSPETYTGYLQASGFASEEDATFDEPKVYEAPRSLPLNYWGLTGSWTVARHAAISNAAGGRIAFQFGARDVNLVMGPARTGDAIPFRSSIRLATEHGPTNDVPADISSVVFYYAAPETSLVRTDSIAVGDAASESAFTEPI